MTTRSSRSALAKLDPKLQEAWRYSERQAHAGAKDARGERQGSQIEPTWDIVVAAMTPEDREKRAELRVRLHEIEATEPDPLPTAYAYVNTGEPPPQSYVLRMGDPHNPLDPVGPGRAARPQGLLRNSQGSATGRRTALANWLASPENPLTARVMVNRIWQFRMGQGIVRTPNDFGVMGDSPRTSTCSTGWRPSSSQQGWSVKTIDRLIVTSSVYRQSSAPTPHAKPSIPTTACTGA